MNRWKNNFKQPKTIKMKFKTGDFAIVIDNFTKHHFEPGQIVEIEQYHTKDSREGCDYIGRTPEDYWWLNAAELYKIEL